MSDNRRSRTITEGVSRSPNRAMLRAVGFTDTDFDKPIVGVANGHSTMNPCNAGIGPLALRAETGLQSQFMDGVLVIGGCDKNMPGAMIAMLRMNIPAIFCYGGTIKPGHWKGQALTIVSPFEAVGAFSAGKMSKEDFDGIEKNACPSFGACGGMYTANTMSSSFEALGMSLLGSSQMANPDPEKGDSVAQSATALVTAVKANLKPCDIVTRKSIENAIALVMATGGSTN